jgi:hypothetical protein
MAFIHVAALVLSLACASPESGRRAPMPLVAQGDAQTVLEGTMEVLVEDADQGSRTLYFLIAGNQRVPLRFLRRPLNLTTGTRVRVRGRWDENHTLVVATIERL